MTGVSVVIPTFNRRDRVSRAILSVLSQTFGDYEIIVVDDGSVDGTSEEMSGFKNNIRYIKNSETRGVSAARNTGIRASNFELIAFLDSDDHWMPEKLETQVKFFMDNTDAVACQTEELWIRRGVRVNPGKKHLKPSGDIFRQSLKLCLVSPSAVMLKRSLLKEVGLFDEELPVCEDYDLWLRIGCRYKIHLIEKKLVVKEGGARDQLSAQYKGMDRFRIKSMMKLLNSGELRGDQIEAVQRELEIKCRIYGEGCIKRGRKEEGEYYLRLPDTGNLSDSWDNRNRNRDRNRKRIK
ncbi:MAG: glycosyltransferase family 2 protein [Deltaproteobacteria bacterium]|nr:glycosyltransferase family 2 protein [Deltaproteobacteria bacterium]